MLKRVTFTGLDDETDIDHLLALEKKYSHINIEWGILLGSKARTPRFPTSIKVSEATLKLKSCSVHLCGNAFDTLINNPYLYSFACFDRIQLNFNAQEKSIKAITLSSIFKMFPKHEFVLQYNKSNQETIEYLTKYKNTNWSVLFDSSGGRGISVVEWPKPLDYVECSYAGGLGPHNLGIELPIISAITNGSPFGIDMEGNIRTNDRFDVNKVEQVLEIINEPIKRKQNLP